MQETLPADPREPTSVLPPEPGSPRLVLRVAGSSFPLGRGQILTAGSAADNDLTLTDRYVSAHHFRVLVESDRAWIEDLGSKNGTFLDGIRIRRAELIAGREIRLGRQRIRVTEPRREPGQVEDAAPDGLVGESAALEAVRAQLERIAPHRLPVLVRGETGTGKELVAQALHRRSPRAAAAFVAVNCAAIPRELAESELFGHQRGAFTHADRDHRGAFARAHRGTLFLDEVAELPPSVQAKLLRVLEAHRLTPVGCEKEIEIDVRVVAATHRDLEQMVADGAFREDLLHRLGVLEIQLPPLRERGEDIPGLLRHFLAQARRDLGVTAELAPDALAAARNHGWPGNVRALRNAVLRAVVMASGPITGEQLLAAARSGAASGLRVSVPRGAFSAMRHDLLQASVAEHGSLRRAALALGVPRSTLAEWLKRGSRAAPSRAGGEV